MFGFDDVKSLRAFCLPTRKPPQIVNRIKALTARHTKENPVKTLYLMPFKPMTVFERYVLSAGASVFGPLFKDVALKLFEQYPQTIIKTTWNRLNLYQEIALSWDTPITGEEWMSGLFDRKQLAASRRIKTNGMSVSASQAPRTRTLSRQPFKKIKPKAEQEKPKSRSAAGLPLILPRDHHKTSTVSGPTRIGRGKMYVPHKTVKATNEVITKDIHSEPIYHGQDMTPVLHPLIVNSLLQGHAPAGVMPVVPPPGHAVLHPTLFSEDHGMILPSSPAMPPMHPTQEPAKPVKEVRPRRVSPRKMPTKTHAGPSRDPPKQHKVDDVSSILDWFCSEMSPHAPMQAHFHSEPADGAMIDHVDPLFEGLFHTHALHGEGAMQGTSPEDMFGSLVNEDVMATMLGL